MMTDPTAEQISQTFFHAMGNLVQAKYVVVREYPASVAPRGTPFRIAAVTDHKGEAYAYSSKHANATNPLSIYEYSGEQGKHVLIVSSDQPGLQPERAGMKEALETFLQARSGQGWVAGNLDLAERMAIGALSAIQPPTAFDFENLCRGIVSYFDSDGFTAKFSINNGVATFEVRDEDGDDLYFCDSADPGLSVRHVGQHTVGEHTYDMVILNEHVVICAFPKHIVWLAIGNQL